MFTVHVTNARSFRPCFIVKVRRKGREVWRCQYSDRDIAQGAGESVAANMAKEESVNAAR